MLVVVTRVVITEILMKDIVFFSKIIFFWNRTVFIITCSFYEYLFQRRVAGNVKKLRHDRHTRIRLISRKE